jgi:hypothetical protein
MSLRHRAVLSFLLCAFALAGVPAVGGAADSPAVSPPESQSEPLTAGESYCRGQRVTVTIRTDTAAANYSITRANATEPILTHESVERGRIVVNTSRLSNGTYALRSGDNRTLAVNASGFVVDADASNATFRVRECTFDARFEHDEVTIHPGATTDLRVDATLTESVILDVPGVSADILAESVDGTVAADGVRVALPDNGRVPLTVTRQFYCGPGTGEYDFTVRSEQSGAVASAQLAMVMEMEAHAAFGATSTNESRNASTIPIVVDDEGATCWEESDVVLRIGTNTSDFRVRTGIRDANDDGHVIVRLDTSTAGTAPASEFLTVADTDSLRDPTLVTDERARPIPEGTYEVNLSANGEELDVGLVPVERNGSFAPPSTVTATRTTTTETPATERTTGATTRAAAEESTPTTGGDGAGFGLVSALAALSVVGFGRGPFRSSSGLLPQLL